MLSLNDSDIENNNCLFNLFSNLLGFPNMFIAFISDISDIINKIILFGL